MKILILGLFVLFSSQVFCQATVPNKYKLVVNLENAPFDSLYLHDYTEGRSIWIAGRKTEKHTWEIGIPDSIVDDFENMKLMVSDYDSTRKSSKLIRFIGQIDSKKVIVVNVGVEDRVNYIYGTYQDSSVFQAENTIAYDFGLTVKDSNSDISVRAKDPFFSWFDNNTSYDSQLASYLKIARENPGSRFLMSNLFFNLNQYKSKRDIESIYNTLSGKHKRTFKAREIERYLNSERFENTLLPALNKRLEFIIQDTSKYNLIVFTASWCAPCIEEIPLLKEIHKDLGENLILTYVSIDDAKGIIRFQKLINEQNIPWRTLLAYKEIAKIKRLYFIQGIPHNILVHPSGDAERIDVRIDNDRRNLYSTLNRYANE